MENISIPRPEIGEPRYPLTTNLRVLADYWRRQAQVVIDCTHAAIGYEKIYFDDVGQVIAVKYEGAICQDGISVDTEPNEGWECDRQTARYIGMVSKWAEYVLADHLHRNAGSGDKPAPPDVGAPPSIIKIAVQDCKDRAEAMLRARGELA